MQAVGRRHQHQGFNDRNRQQISRSYLPLSQDSLQFGPHFFNGIQIRAIRREIEEPNTGGFKSLLHTLNVMRAQIIHHNNVTGLQFRDKLVFQVGRKAVSRCSAGVCFGNVAAINPNGRQHSRYSGFIQRCMIYNPRLADAAPVQSRQVGIDTAFVQINQMAWVDSA